MIPTGLARTIIASRIQIFRAEAAKLPRSKEMYRGCIPPSSVNSSLFPSKMHIWVDNRVLYVSVHQKTERFHTELSF